MKKHVKFFLGSTKVHEQDFGKKPEVGTQVVNAEKAGFKITSIVEDTCPDSFIAQVKPC